jgi:hypothetical protein
MFELPGRLTSALPSLTAVVCMAALWLGGCDKSPPDKAPDSDPSTSPSCAEGEVSTDGHCCLAGQTWSSESEACEGVPSCPNDTSYGDGCPPDALSAERRVEWLMLACDDDQQPACGVLSAHYLTGNGIEKDAVRARELAKAACNSDGWSGCNTLGLLHIQSNTQDAAPTKARKFFARACEHDDGEACKNLALMYARGVGLEEDQKHALALYRKSCGLEFQPACKVVERMEKMDQERAQGLLDEATEACDRGDQRACARAGEILLFGSAGDPDVPRGLTILDDSCGAGVGAACRVLATAFYAGEGVESDGERARVFAERGCALDEFDACNILGLLYMTDGGPAVDLARARDILARACEAENPRACSNLGRAYLLESDDVERRPTKARDALEFACGRDVNDACNRLEQLKNNKKPQ